MVQPNICDRVTIIFIRMYRLKIIYLVPVLKKIVQNKV
jgi:hypothetical protein